MKPSARTRFLAVLPDNHRWVKDAVVVPRCSLDEPPTPPPLPPTKALEFADSSIRFCHPQSYIRCWCLFLSFSVCGYCSLPDVTLTPPRMFLLGALVQVLLVPPSGYRCFRRRPGCLASVLGVIVVH